MIVDFLETVIKNTLKKKGWDIQGEYLDFPSDRRFGDLTTNVAFRLSRQLRRSPSAVASEFIEALRSEPIFVKEIQRYIRDIKIEGAGFINFYFTDDYFYLQLKQVISKGADYFRPNLGCGKSVLIEFVSANPTGPLSVAHARQAAVGDALAEIMSYCGFKVSREYYLNDEGNQIFILGKSVELRLKQLQGERIDFPQDYYQGGYIYDIAKEILNQKERVIDFQEFAKDYILTIIKKELDDFGVKFDNWYSQKELNRSGKIKLVLEELRQKGFIYEKDGALWFRSSALGDDKDRVVIKSDGSYTYLAPDISYHQDKYKRNYKLLINLWGPDHHGYINRLKAAVRALGEEDGSLVIVIVQLATIFRDGKAIQMSTRKGQYITLREVLDEVGRDASRFFFLMRKTSSHLDFDIEIAKKQSPENPVYYIQYAYARICSILRSSGINNLKCGVEELSLLKEEEEMALIKKIFQFSPILSICVHTFDPYMLTVYLMELAEAFHRFYDRHRVLTENTGLRQARLALIAATRLTIGEGLRLLGVSRPEKM